MYYRDLNLFLPRLKYIYVNTDKSVTDSEISGTVFNKIGMVLIRVNTVFSNTISVW
jgi:hypothetical protein